uniref:Testis-expressed protein 13 A-D N-terminal domain-containing protein n=1 Tax=Suricata suricatta TaxID=37032 RepID=A0A673TLV0_SURSU
MALDFGDPRSGFRHHEVVAFINEEVLSNGGCAEFYRTFSSKPWNEIEDKLLSIVADPQVPRTVKRAYSWSALALGVRAATRQQEQQGRRIWRLQEQLEERETTTWALASQLQRLRGEHEQAVSQLRRVQHSLQQALEEREALRRQLLQGQRQPSQPPCPTPRFSAEGWPPMVEEQSEVLTTAWLQREQNAEMQREARLAAAMATATATTTATTKAGGFQVATAAATTTATTKAGGFQVATAAATTTAGGFQVPRPLGPWAQVVQPPGLMPLPVQFPLAPPRPPSPPHRLVEEIAAGEAFPPQRPPRSIWSLGMWPPLGSQEETFLPWDPRIQVQEEGAVRSRFINLPGNNWSHGDSMKQQPQGQMPRQADGKTLPETQGK